MDQRPGTSPTLTLPGAVIVAGALIAIAIIWVERPAGAPAAANPAAPVMKDIAMKPISADDHILGNPSAPIKFVEYSDPSCPFCKIFNPTMEQLMAEHGGSGDVAWIYRQFPIDKPGTRSDGGILHPNAGREAQAMECAGSLGGEKAFWAYERAWFDAASQATAEANAEDDLSSIAKVAASVGLNAKAMTDCASSGRFKDRVEAQYVDGVNAGVSGTPYTVIITPSGSKIPLVGAQTYGTVNATIAALLSGIGAQAAAAPGGGAGSGGQAQ